MTRCSSTPSRRTRNAPEPDELDEGRDQCGGPPRAVRLYWCVAHRAVYLAGDRSGQCFGIGVGVGHTPAAAIALEPMPHVVVLLEVVAQREIEEQSTEGGELHAGRQAALHDREIAGTEVLIELVDV